MMMMRVIPGVAVCTVMMVDVVVVSMDEILFLQFFVRFFFVFPRPAKKWTHKVWLPLSGPILQTAALHSISPRCSMVDVGATWLS